MVASWHDGQLHFVEYHCRRSRSGKDHAWEVRSHLRVSHQDDPDGFLDGDGLMIHARCKECNVGYYLSDVMDAVRFAERRDK